ncbi:hypothetical protein [Nonomuraea sp. 10N515B]|uniref:hypothetical protein n=1 Tax=Nonomuraea sp. 10N515B TaxID=3457422 RepID=UPI003FCC33F5
MPTFLAHTGLGSPQEMLEQVRSTPRSQIRTSLAFVAERQPLPSWAHHLADDRDVLRQVLIGLEHVYDRLMDPHWPQIASFTAADQGARVRQMTTGGLEVLTE